MTTFEIKSMDVKKMVYAGTHIGNASVNIKMKQFIFSQKENASFINLKDTWNNLVLAARILAGVQNPADICVVSSNPLGTRAVLKFASFIHATPIAGRYTPGTLTNQIQKAFKEPRIIVVTDPMADHRIIKESSYVGIPVIAFCNSSSPLEYIDLSKKSIGLMWWLLTREVLRFKGLLRRDADWNIMPDLFMFRSPNEDIEPQQTTEDKQTSATQPKQITNVETQTREAVEAPIPASHEEEARGWASAVHPVTTGTVAGKEWE